MWILKLKVFGLRVNYLICSLDFRYTEALVRRCSSEQVLLKNSQCWSFFLIKLQAFWNAILLKRDFNISAFLWNSQNLEEHLFLQSTSGGYFWKYLMNSLFIAYENDESCHCVVCIGSPALISFYCLRFVSFHFFLLFLFFVDFTTCLGNEVNLSILEIKVWSCSYIPKWRFEGWVGSALLSIIYVVGLVQFWEKLSYILPPLASLELLAAEYLREANTSNFIYYHLLMAICSLDALKKSSKKKEMRIKKGKIYTVERKQKSKKPGW